MASGVLQCEAVCSVVLYRAPTASPMQTALVIDGTASEANEMDVLGLLTLVVRVVALKKCQA